MQEILSHDDVASFSRSFDSDPKNRLALNAVTKTDIAAVALSRERVNLTNHTYSHLIETPEATNQKSTGRCWLFAGLNTFRLEAMKQMNLASFELSQAYPMFWDKLEKTNFFLENVIETRDELLDGRLVMWLLSDPIPDGGQWDMFVSLIDKYGVVPKSVMPETHSSSQSGSMNQALVTKLREYAQVLREAHAASASLSELRQSKERMMADLYRILCIHLGKPPSSFYWEWRDKDKKFQRRGNITPREFYAEYVGLDLDDLVCLIKAPTQDKPYDKLYTVQYLGNVVGGQPVRYLNVSMDVFKKATADTIVDGEAVWFGCDVGKMLERDLGVLDLDVYNYELVYGTGFGLDKAGRLDYGHSRMTHAMVFTGVDLDEDERPLKWRVENSWGTEHADKGYLAMTDAWFDEFVYEVVVSRKRLSPQLLAAIEVDPIVLPPWDPMGALARSV